MCTQGKKRFILHHGSQTAPASQINRRILRVLPVSKLADLAKSEKQSHRQGTNYKTGTAAKGRPAP
jgi:hypothetical protein